jgi:hypothetical protein
VLELLDLRDRRELLEPRRLEIDPHVSAIVREIVRLFDYEKDDLFELTLRFTKSAARRPPARSCRLSRWTTARQALTPEVAVITRSEGSESHARAVEVRTDERRARS